MRNALVSIAMRSVVRAAAAIAVVALLPSCSRAGDAGVCTKGLLECREQIVNELEFRPLWPQPSDRWTFVEAAVASSEGSPSALVELLATTTGGTVSVSLGARATSADGAADGVIERTIRGREIVVSVYGHGRVYRAVYVARGVRYVVTVNGTRAAITADAADVAADLVDSLR